MKHPLSREQYEELVQLALDIEREELSKATNEEQEDQALQHRQGAWHLLNEAFDERK